MQPSLPAIATEGPRRPSFLSTIAGLGVSSILIVVLLMVLAIWNRKFYTPLNLIDVVRNASNLVIVSLGQAVVLIVGGFDL